jgi:UDP-N-acetylmuramyl pentapeptide synthase
MLALLEAQIGKKAHYSHYANSAYGVAFDILGLRGITGSKLRWLYLFFITPIRALYFRRNGEFYIVEIDGERPHETKFLAKWLRPEVTVWISLGRSHAGQFDAEVAAGKFATVEQAITHEFATLPHYTKKLVLIDEDNPLMATATTGISPKVTPLSKSSVSSYKVYPTHTDFTLGSHTFHFAQPMPPDLSIQLVMLKHLLVYLKQPITYDLSALPVPPGRNNYFKGKNGAHLIDSSYNAHLISMASILEMVRRMYAAHKWLIIGDIIDQGAGEADDHKELAHLIASVKPKQVVLVGNRTHKYTLPELKKLEVPTKSFINPQEALEFLEKNIAKDQTLVFKGSQYLEWLVEKLLNNPSDAEKLPRREPAAIKRRRKRGLL